jgi:hypothetical protein
MWVGSWRRGPSGFLVEFYDVSRKDHKCLIGFFVLVCPMVCHGLFRTAGLLLLAAQLGVGSISRRATFRRHLQGDVRLACFIVRVCFRVVCSLCHDRSCGRLRTNYGIEVKVRILVYTYGGLLVLRITCVMIARAVDICYSHTYVINDVWYAVTHCVSLDAMIACAVDIIRSKVYLICQGCLWQKNVLIFLSICIALLVLSSYSSCRHPH